MSRLVQRASNFVHRTLSNAGMKQPESKIAADSQSYWNKTDDDRWESNSHWRDSTDFAGRELWSEIGRKHLEMFERSIRITDFDRPWGRVVEWGCGGGANAVHFAPRAQEFIGVDVSADTLEECGRQVGAACDTPFRPVLIDVGEPEKAAVGLAGTCDIFLAYYVFELLPSPEYGERVLRIAHDMLAPGGLAMIQVKYHADGLPYKPSRWHYTLDLSNMTTYPIASFWELTGDCGLTPESVQLVPKNELDKRYAYFLLSKPAEPATT